MDLGDPSFGQPGDQFGEAARVKDETGGFGLRLRPVASGRNRIGIAIKGVNRRAGFEQAAGITSRAERGVDHDRAS